MEQGQRQPEDLPHAVAIPPPSPHVALAVYPVDEEELLTLQRICQVPRDVALEILRLMHAVLDL